MLRWNLSDLVYQPKFNLGIGEEWLPKYPVFVLNQDNFTNDNDAELRHRIGARGEANMPA